MGCCCSQPDKEDESSDVRTPLLSGTQSTSRGASQNPKYEAMQEPPQAEIPHQLDLALTNDEHPRARGAARKESESLPPVVEETIPKESLVTTESKTDDSEHQAPAFSEALHRDLMDKYNDHVESHNELRDSIRNLELMYPDANPDKSIKGCLAHVRNSCGDAVTISEDGMKSPVQLQYTEDQINHAIIPALVEFNKASELVRDLTNKGTVLSQMMADAVAREIDRQREASKQGRTTTQDGNTDELNKLTAEVAALQSQAVTVHKQLDDAVSALKSAETPTIVASESPLSGPEHSEAQNDSKTQQEHHALVDTSIASGTSADDTHDKSSVDVDTEKVDINTEETRAGHMGVAASPKEVHNDKREQVGSQAVDTRCEEDKKEESDAQNSTAEVQESSEASDSDEDIPVSRDAPTIIHRPDVSEVHLHDTSVEDKDDSFKTSDSTDPNTSALSDESSFQDSKNEGISPEHESDVNNTQAVSVVHFEDQKDDSLTDSQENKDRPKVMHDHQYSGPPSIQKNLLGIDDIEKARLASTKSSVSEYHEALENMEESPKKHDTSDASTLLSEEGTFGTTDDDDAADDSIAKDVPMASDASSQDISMSSP